MSAYNAMCYHAVSRFSRIKKRFFSNCPEWIWKRWEADRLSRKLRQMAATSIDWIKGLNSMSASVYVCSHFSGINGGKLENYFMCRMEIFNGETKTPKTGSMTSLGRVYAILNVFCKITSFSVELMWLYSKCSIVNTGNDCPVVGSKCEYSRIQKSG